MTTVADAFKGLAAHLRDVLPRLVSRQEVLVPNFCHSFGERPPRTETIEVVDMDQLIREIDTFAESLRAQPARDRKSRTEQNKTEQREGYWGSRFESNLPMPVPKDKPWEGQELLLRRLRRLQAEESTIRVCYMGWSTCRICGKANGSQEFLTKGWRWPEGFAHYVEAHNVKPSKGFRKMLGVE